MKNRRKVKTRFGVLSAAIWSILCASAQFAPTSTAQAALDNAKHTSLAKLGALTIEGTQIKLELISNSPEVLTCMLAPAVELSSGDMLIAEAQEFILRSQRTLTIDFDFSDQIESAGEAAKQAIKGFLLEASTFACEVVREDQDLWADDNGAARLATRPDQFSYVSRDQTEKHNKVEFLLHSSAEYVRLCDLVVVLEFATPDGDLGIKERFFLQKKILHPAYELPISMDFSDTVETDPRLVLKASRLSLSCLRWTGITVPDPQRNQAQRPKALPHEVCDPESKQCVPLVQKEIGQ